MSYISLKQRPYLCVAACLEMVLNRRNIPHKSQIEIGQALGLVIPEDKAWLFSGVQTSEIRPEAGWGTQVQKEEYSLNNFFKENNIDLMETYTPLSAIPNVKKFLEENLKTDSDVLVCFNTAPLDPSGGDYGHINIIEMLKDNTVTLIDPAGKFYPKREVSLGMLIKAITVHGESNRAGFWIISNKKIPS